MPVPLDLPGTVGSAATVPSTGPGAHGVIVVGAGRFGTLHASKLTARPDVRLCAVVDPDLDRARRLAATAPGALAFGTVEDVPRTLGADIALVATPIAALAPTARTLFVRGFHCLVEKPAAQTAREASLLIAAAAEARRLFAVGFVERFNAGLSALPPGARALVVRRIGPARPEAGSIALDWGIHDLDLAHHLLGGALSVEAARLGADHLRVRLRGPQGTQALLVASRGHPRTTRRLWVDGLRVDLVSPGTRDALAEQWAAFLSGVRGGPTGPLATGPDAMAALTLVEGVQRLARAGERAAG
jgi:predicted dehydrogenase